MTAGGVRFVSLYAIRNTVDKGGLTTSLVTVFDMAESNLYCDLL